MASDENQELNKLNENRKRSSYQIVMEERATKLKERLRSQFQDSFRRAEQRYISNLVFVGKRVDVGFEGYTQKIQRDLEVVGAYLRREREYKSLLNFRTESERERYPTLDECNAMNSLINEFKVIEKADWVLDHWPSMTDLLEWPFETMLDNLAPAFDSMTDLLEQTAIQVASARDRDVAIHLIRHAYNGEFLVQSSDARQMFMDKVGENGLINENVRIRILPALDGSNNGAHDDDGDDSEIEWVEG